MAPLQSVNLRAVKIELIIRLRCRRFFSECFISSLESSEIDNLRLSSADIFDIRRCTIAASASNRADERACGIRFVFAAVRVFSFVIRGFLHYHEFVRQGTRTRYETDGCPLSFARLD